jgi:hypothetical protein
MATARNKACALSNSAPFLAGVRIFRRAPWRIVREIRAFTLRLRRSIVRKISIRISRRYAARKPVTFLGPSHSVDLLIKV